MGWWRIEGYEDGKSLNVVPEPCYILKPRNAKAHPQHGGPVRRIDTRTYLTCVLLSPILLIHLPSSFSTSISLHGPNYSLLLTPRHIRNLTPSCFPLMTFLSHRHGMWVLHIPYMCNRALTNTKKRQYGWRTAKRPGVDYFLAYVSQFYEVVIFTSQPYYVSVQYRIP